MSMKHALECSVFQFDQVDLSHRCRFSCHGMSSVSMLQCPGSTDTLYGREPRRQGWHTIAYAAQTLKFVTSTLVPSNPESARLELISGAGRQ